MQLCLHLSSVLGLLLQGLAQCRDRLRQPLVLLRWHQAHVGQPLLQSADLIAQHSGAAVYGDRDLLVDLGTGDLAQKVAAFFFGREKKAVEVTLRKQHGAAELIEGQARNLLYAALHLGLAVGERPQGVAVDLE